MSRLPLPSLCLIGCLAISGILVAARGQTSSADRPRLERVGGTHSPVGWLRPGDVAPVPAVIANPSDADASATVVVWDPRSPLRQWGRELWVPARATRHVDIPFLLEQGLDDPRKQGMDLQFRLLQAGVGETGDVPLDEAVGALPVIAANETTTLLLGNNAGGDAARMIRLIRGERGDSQRVVAKPPHEAATDPLTYDTVDEIILAAGSDELLSPQVEAIRGWVAGGGRAVLVMSELDATLGPRLLGGMGMEGVGEGWPLAVLGEEAVALDADEPVNAGGEATGGSILSDATYRHLVWGEPRLVRVWWPASSGEGIEVLSRVGGEAAALRWRYGAGEVVVLLLEPRGWMVPRASGSSEAAAWLGEAARAMGRPRAEQHDRRVGLSGATYLQGDAPSLAAAMDTYAATAIGYRVPGRGWVGPWLLAVVVAGPVAVGGLWWLRRRTAGRGGRRGWGVGWGWGVEWATLATVAVAVVATVAILLAAIAHRGSVSTTASVLQIVRGHADGAPPTVLTTAAVLRNASEHPTLPLRGRGGYPLIESLGESGAAGGVRRVVFDDAGGWRIEPFNPPAASVQTLAVHAAAPPTDATPPVIARLSSNGTTITPADGTLPLADPVLISAAGAFAIEASPGRGWVLDADAPLPRGQFTRSATLSADAVERQRLLRVAADHPLLQGQPLLMGWLAASDDADNTDADAVAGPLLWPVDVQVIRRSLVATPIRLVIEPEAGETLRIPAAFVSVAATRPDSTGTRTASGVLVDAQGRWVPDVSTPARVSVAVTPPPAAAPLDLRSIHLTIDAHAPGWSLRWLPVNPASAEPLAQIDSPTTPQSVTLSPASLGPATGDGSYHVLLEVTRPLDPTGPLPPPYSIRSISASLDVTARQSDPVGSD